MTTAARTTSIPVERVMLHGIAWSTYEAILADMNDRPIRLTYDRGDLEIMLPSGQHVRFKKLIGRMIEAMTEELDIPLMSAGSTTFKQQMKQRGLEPDECYYIAHEALMRDHDDVDLTVDPPPDLAVKVDITSSSLDRMGIHASLGVPEVWRYDGVTLEINRLAPDGRYAQQSQSQYFPFLAPERVCEFLERRNETDETTWIRSFRTWIREMAAR